MKKEIDALNRIQTKEKNFYEEKLYDFMNYERILPIFPRRGFTTTITNITGDTTAAQPNELVTFRIPDPPEQFPRTYTMETIPLRQWLNPNIVYLGDEND